MNDQPDPKLQLALDEILPVIRKHDLAAHITVCCPPDVMYRFELTPSWSCIRIEEGMLRIRALREDFDSQEAQKTMLENSTGMLCGFIDSMNSAKESFDNLLLMIGRHMEINHTSVHEPMIKAQICSFEQDGIEKAAVRIQRNGKWQSVEFGELTDEELEYCAAERPEMGWAWAKFMVRRHRKAEQS